MGHFFGGPAHAHSIFAALDFELRHIGGVEQVQNFFDLFDCHSD
jgi:hypothetical protein